MGGVFGVLWFWAKNCPVDGAMGWFSEVLGFFRVFSGFRAAG
jgi:hypothetical protein